MTRIEAMTTVQKIAESFSCDDVKDWLAEAATAMSGAARREGDEETAVELMRFGNEIARVQNRGV